MVYEVVTGRCSVRDRSAPGLQAAGVTVDTKPLFILLRNGLIVATNPHHSSPHVGAPKVNTEFLTQSRRPEELGTIGLVP